MGKPIRQAKPVTYDDVIRMQAVACQPCPRGRGIESQATANARGQMDAAANAGIDGISAHSLRVVLASELTAREVSTTETMLAGGWSAARMVAHYSAGAKAERGAVAKYL